MDKNNFLFFDDFATDSDIWTTAGTVGRGKPRAAGGVMRLPAVVPGMKGQICGVLTLPEHSGVVKRAVCDIMFDTQRCSVGFFLCFNTKGYYIVQLLLRENGRKPLSTLRICKQCSGRTGVLTLFESDDLSSLGIDAKANRWHNLDVGLDSGRFTVLIDGLPVCDYTDRDGFFSAGQFGLRASDCNGYYKNLAVFGEVGPYPAMPPEPAGSPSSFDIYTANLPTGCRPPEFCEHAGSNDWSVVDIGGERRLFTGRAGHAVCWVHAYEKNPAISADLCVHDFGPAAEFGLFGRFGTDDSYVRFGYDAAAGGWFCEYREGTDFEPVRIPGCRADRPTPGQTYNMTVALDGGRASLSVDGRVCLKTGDIAHTGWGRCGVFGDDTALSASHLHLSFPNGGRPVFGVVSANLFPGHYIHALETERVDRDTVFAFMCDRRAISKDGGLTFTDVSEQYPEINPGHGYPSILHLKSGGFLQFNLFDNFAVEYSRDMKNWEYRSRVLPPEEQCDEQGRRLAILHVSTPTELTVSAGCERIFLPVAHRRYNSSGYVTGHFTRVFYSDDEGFSWQESKNDTRSVCDRADGFCSWSESKIICGNDGVLRMYYTRNQVGCVAYTSSFDGGLTWSGFNLIPEMPCAMSSFGICEDPTSPGTYFMAYVKNIPYNDTSLFPRTHLVLVRTRDGLLWEEVADIDRFSQPSDSTWGAELYQILDPSVTVCDDYIYVGYGRSNGFAPAYHNAQRARYLRIDRAAAGI